MREKKALGKGLGEGRSAAELLSNRRTVAEGAFTAPVLRDAARAAGVEMPVVEAVWSITDRNMLRVRVGAERGGYTCSGGVCREEAPFNGIKATLISRF